MRKEKAIYHTMNLFSLDITSKCLVAEGWCPVADLSTIQQSLLRSSVRLRGRPRVLLVAAAAPCADAGRRVRRSPPLGTVQDKLVPTVLHRVETHEVPPTFHRTNKFTAGFQVRAGAGGLGRPRRR